MKDKKLRREESFFGLHFDFHASDKTESIGEETTYESIAKIIDAVEPDFIQCDCKGHPGFSSYPTKVGNMASGVKADALKIWRKVTEDKNVALYVHYSGVHDYKAVADHKEWAATNADGTPHDKSTSLFGDYADKLLIPQLKELAGEYGIDGAWIDGECWGIVNNYSEKALAEFKAATGITEIPKSKTDKYYRQLCDFSREKFFDYLEHYTSEVKKEYPNFQIASNWAFTASHCPEPPRDCVDFISGDIVPVDTLNAVRFDAKYLPWQNRTWDLMGWSFGRCENTLNASDKSLPMMKQEASFVLSQGGGYQVYYFQNADGSPKMETLKTAPEIAKFCRERQAFCHKQKIKPGVAIFLSKEAMYDENMDYCFWFGDGMLDNVRIAGELLAKNQYNVNVVSEHHLDEDINRFPIIVVPEWKSVRNKKQLIEYAENGGKLIIMGAYLTRGFANELGVEFIDEEPSETQLAFKKNELYSSFGEGLILSKFEPKTAKVIANGYTSLRKEGIEYPIATVNKCGKGEIVGIYLDFLRSYRKARSVGIIDFVGDVISIVYEPDVKVEGNRFVEVSVGEKEGKTIINLVNSFGGLESQDLSTFDWLPEIKDIKVTVKTDKKPNRVTLQPSNTELPFNFDGEKLTLTVEKLEYYEMIIIE